MSGCPFLKAKARQQQGPASQEAPGWKGQEAQRCPFSRTRVLPEPGNAPEAPPAAAADLETPSAARETSSSGDASCPRDADLSSAPSAAAAPASAPALPAQCPLGFSSSAPRVAVGDLECPLCLALLHLPVRCRPCLHIFCRDCVGPFSDCPACGADVEALEPDSTRRGAVEALLAAQALGGLSLGEHLGQGTAKEGAPGTPQSSGATSAADGASESEAGPAPRPPVATPMLPASTSSPSAFLFLQAMRALRRGNMASAQARLRLCIAELRREQAQLLLTVTHSPQHQHRQQQQDAASPKPAEAKGPGVCLFAREPASPATASTDARERAGQGPSPTALPRSGCPFSRGAPQDPSLPAQAGGGTPEGARALMELLLRMLEEDQGAAAPRLDACPTAGSDAGASPCEAALEPLAGVLTRLGAALGSLGDCCAMVGDLEQAAASYVEAIQSLEHFAVRTRSPGAPESDAECRPGSSTRGSDESSYRLRSGFRLEGSQGELLRALSVTLNKLGDLHFRTGQLPSALCLYRRALALRAQTLELMAPLEVQTTEASSDAVLDLCVSLAKVADVQQELGGTEAARCGFRRALRLAEAPQLSPKEALAELTSEGPESKGLDTGDGEGSTPCTAEPAAQESSSAQLSKRSRIVAMLRSRVV